MRRSLLSMFLCVLVLAGCGQPVCVFDLGSCSSFDRSDTNLNTSTTGLTITGPTTISLITPAQTYTPSGGISPYSFTIATTSPTANCGSFNPNVNVVGNTTLTVTTVGVCQIQVSDASSPPNTTTLTLTVTN